MQRDTLVFDLIHKELERQRHGIELIASENFTSLQVMQAMGNVMTNKYAEGYPGRRYYGGCEIVDMTESLAIERLKQIFNLEYANVQPHSGAQANAAVCLAVLKPGDKILGLDLSMGGHLTHGSPVNFSGKLYEPHFLWSGERNRIDRLCNAGEQSPRSKTYHDYLRRKCLQPRLGLCTHKKSSR